MEDLKKEFIAKIKSYEKLPFRYTDHVLKKSLERFISLDEVYLDIKLNKNLIKTLLEKYIRNIGLDWL